MQLCRIICYSLAALHVSSDIFARHQEHLNCIYSFWYYTRMLLPAGIIGELVRSSRSTRSCKYSLDAPDDERKYRSKHVAQPRNNIILHSCILLVIFVKYIMMHGTTNIKSLEYLLILDPLEMFRSL